MRILITGGFGFVGGRLGEHLQRARHQVILGTRKESCSPAWLPQAEAVTTSWHDVHALARICSGVDVVIHAAGMNAVACAADPVAALEFNGLSTARLVAAAAQAGVKRFIYLSSAHVYASPLIGAITEDTCPHNLHPYATTHLAGEYAVLGANQRREVEGIVLRLSNVFGRPTHMAVNCWMLLVNNLCRQAAQTRKMVLHTRGLQQRDFIAMEEVCRVVEHLSVSASEVTAPSLFNVGSGFSKTVLEMARLVQRRSQVVLGFEPIIERPKAGINERHELLAYRSERLAKLVDTKTHDDNIEIDRLLSLCKIS